MFARTYLGYKNSVALQGCNRSLNMICLCPTPLGFQANVCIILGTDGGTLWGFNQSFGSATPDQTVEGVKFYSQTWDTVTGLFQIRFGDTGETKLENVSKLYIEGMTGYKVIAPWNETTLCYEFTNLTIANEESMTTVDEIVCFKMVVVPDLLIWYDYSKVEIEEEVETTVYTQYGGTQ